MLSATHVAQTCHGLITVHQIVSDFFLVLLHTCLQTLTVESIGKMIASARQKFYVSRHLIRTHFFHCSILLYNTSQILRVAL